MVKKSREFCVSLSDLRFNARIGLFEQERKIGNAFRVDVEIWYDAARFVEEDLTTGISYADLYQIVREEMMRETLLLESVILRIERRLKQKYQFITGGEIRIVKLVPPISGIEGNGSVILRF